jgi:hypothetical protein
VTVPSDQLGQPRTTTAPAPIADATPAAPAATVAAPVQHRHHVVVVPIEKLAPSAKHHHVAAPVHHARRVVLTLTSALHKLLSRPTLPGSAPLPTRPIAFVPAQGVTLVPPTEVPGPASVEIKPTRSAGLPKSPTLPPAPSSPANDAPASFAAGLSGPAGGALLLVAALAAVLLITPPWLTSRVALAAAAPVEWRRRLSLERPG